MKPLDVIESWAVHWPSGIAYHLGQALEHIAQAGLLRGCATVEHLGQARMMIDRALAQLARRPTPASWVTPFADRPGVYARCDGRVYGPCVSKRAALVLIDKPGVVVEFREVAGAPPSMTREDAISLMQQYARVRRRWAPDNELSCKIEDLAKRAPVECTAPKAMRWLGFVQGALWGAGTYSSDELKEHSRTRVVG